MAKRREQRYESAGELAQEVRRWLADEPVAAFPEPLIVRAGRWARRHKTAVVGVGALAAAAVLYLAVVAIISEHARAQSERDRLATEEARAEAVKNFNAAEEQRKQTETARQQAVDNFNTAEEQRVRASANFQKACDAVDALLSQVGSNDLADVPHMEKVRERLLGRALAFQQEFLKEKSDDPAVRLETARVHLRVAALSQKLDKRADAGQNLDNAIGLLAALARERKTDAVPRQHLALAYDLRGITLAETMRFQDAEKAYGRSLELYDGLLIDAPQNPNYRHDRAVTQTHLGEMLETAGRYRDAEKVLREARDTFAGLAVGAPPGSELRVSLALAKGYLAALLANQQQLADADNEFRASLAMLEELARADPESRLPLYLLSRGGTTTTPTCS